MKTSNLQIRAFPQDVNKALKKKAIDLNISFRELIIRLLTAGAKA